MALLWNGFGAFDYLMTRMRNVDYFKSAMPDADPQAVLAWVDAFPFYAQFGWGLGVWGGLVGAILLLMRSRWAVVAFAASLVGAVLGLGYQLLVAPPMPGMEGPGGKIDAGRHHPRRARPVPLRPGDEGEGRAALG